MQIKIWKAALKGTGKHKLLTPGPGPAPGQECEAKPSQGKLHLPGLGVATVGLQYRLQDGLKLLGTSPNTVIKALKKGNLNQTTVAYCVLFYSTSYKIVTRLFS